jgi:hypothetical protein
MSSNIRNIGISSIKPDFQKLLDVKLQEIMTLEVERRERAFNTKILTAAERFRKNDLGSDDESTRNDAIEGGSDKYIEQARESYGEFNPSDIKIQEEVLDETKIEVSTIICDTFISNNGLNNAHTWYPYQLISAFGEWKPVKNAAGQYNALATLTANIGDSYNFGLWRLALNPLRALFDKAPKGIRQYNSPVNPLVPIILAGFKQSQGIEYSEWSREGLEWLVPAPLLQAMICSVPELSVSERLELRNTAVTDKTGPRAGKLNDVATCIKLNHLTGSAIDHLPKLAKYMVLQTWCGHPSNWNKYSVVDPASWDTKPDPLVPVSVVHTAQPAKFSFATSSKGIW